LIKSPTFVLLGATSQSSLDKADERGRMKRSFQKGQVGKQLNQVGGAGIALDTAAVLGQNNKGEIRPRWLGGYPVGQGAKVGTSNRLFGHDGGVGAAFQILEQFVDVDADVCTQSCVSQKTFGYDSIATVGGEDQ